jgi:tellurite resistance protein
MEHTALIYTMVLVSASDGHMKDAELRTMGDIVRTIPAFRGYSSDFLPMAAKDCADMLNEKDGLDKVLTFIDRSLPQVLRETAYVIACEIAVADGKLEQEELRLLEMIRHRLGVGRLPAAAIERGVKARYTPFNKNADGGRKTAKPRAAKAKSR